eukprot:CAMPEP_0178996422 /NCGR_PEP_ID=MMETSP0795-20121207/8358_1 /TAXON_ID=88552 /ORGANISM="Amoebophrya sp., Strain Ameob2" /LENGTH=153 /DNA_ID=CAMNT_0020688807 /DNA_START=493 /DNA_END=954 /DNA_ORIENTATION=+
MTTLKLWFKDHAAYLLCTTYVLLALVVFASVFVSAAEMEVVAKNKLNLLPVGPGAGVVVDTRPLVTFREGGSAAPVSTPHLGPALFHPGTTGGDEDMAVPRVPRRVPDLPMLPELPCGRRWSKSSILNLPTMTCVCLAGWFGGRLLEIAWIFV